MARPFSWPLRIHRAFDRQIIQCEYSGTRPNKKFRNSIEYEDCRCIYENIVILALRKVAEIPSIDREACLLVHLKKVDFCLEQKKAQCLNCLNFNRLYTKLYNFFQSLLRKKLGAFFKNISQQPPLLLILFHSYYF